MVMQSVMSSSPATVSTNVSVLRRVPPISLGLSMAERRELEWFFCEYEAEVGLRSTFREMVEGVAGARGVEVNGPTPKRSSGASSFDDKMPDLVARGVLRRARDTFHALEQLPSNHVRVLWLLHGPGKPSPFRPEFGEVADIVHLTPAVEAARAQMATKEANVRVARVTTSYASSLEDQRTAIEASFWDAAGSFARLEQRIAMRRSKPRCNTAKGQAITFALQRRRDAWRSLLERLLRAFAYDGTVSAQTTSMMSAQLELTPHFVVRWQLGYHGPLIGGKPHPAALKMHAATRSTFVATVRREAERMRISASVAYREARRRVAAANARRRAASIARVKARRRAGAS